MLVRVCDINPTHGKITTYRIPVGPDSVTWNACDLDLCDACVGNILFSVYGCQRYQTIHDMLSNTSASTFGSIMPSLMIHFLHEAQDDPQLVLDFWKVVVASNPAYKRKS